VDDTEALEDSDADVDAATASGPRFLRGRHRRLGRRLKAIKALLEGPAAAPDMAFVVVLHLSPTHESNADAIFQQSTACRGASPRG
jgi:hypothetical protein